jgi:translation initiation factor IF-3
MDYGKFKFDEAQRQKESRRKGSSTGIKEMKYRPKIGKGDFDTKTRQVAKFLADGHKVKVTIMFQGREVFHPELGRKILDGIAEVVEGSAKVESEARLDGRNMVMVLAPDRRARQSQAARTGTGTAEAAPRTAAPSAATEAPAPLATSAVPAASAAPTEIADAVAETEKETPNAKDED